MKNVRKEVYRRCYVSANVFSFLYSVLHRLTLYSTKKLYEEFYAVCEKIFSITVDEERIDIIDGYTAKLLADLQHFEREKIQ